MEKIKDLMVEIPKTEAFLNASKDMSNFLLTLNISTKEYDELIKKLLKYTSIVRKDAFMLGISQRITEDTEE